MTWRQIIRDFLRGYTDADLASVTSKLNDSRNCPGDVIPVTRPELAAVGEYMRRCNVLVIDDSSLPRTETKP